MGQLRYPTPDNGGTWRHPDGFRNRSAEVEVGDIDLDIRINPIFRDYKSKNANTRISISINSLDRNRLCNKVREIPQTHLCKNAIIVKFNDGIFFSR